MNPVPLRSKAVGCGLTCKFLVCVSVSLAVLLLVSASTADPLLSSVQAGDTRTLQIILDIIPELASHTNSYALHHAADRNNAGMVRLLMEKRAPVERKDPSGHSPLFYARSHEVFEMLLNARQSPLPPTEAKLLLLKAAEKADEKRVDLLLKLKVIPAFDFETQGDLFLSVLAGGSRTILKMFQEIPGEHREIIKIILTESERVIAKRVAQRKVHRPEELKGLLLWAARNGMKDLAASLLDEGVNPNVMTALGTTPLLAAVHAKNASMVSKLLKAGASTNQKDYMGWTPLLLACDKKAAPICELLLKHKADPNQVSNRTTPLTQATFQGSLKLCKILVKSGADVNYVAPQTPLHFAARTGSKSILKFLLQQGANPNLQDGFGQTALHEAVIGGVVECVESLLEARADPNIVSSMGTPIALATAKNDSKMVELLLRNRARPFVEDSRLFTPLQIAAWSGNLNVVKLLLNAGAPLEEGNGNSAIRCAFMLVPWDQYFRIGEFISGADKALGLRTPLVYAGLMKAWARHDLVPEKIKIIDLLLNLGHPLVKKSNIGLSELHLAVDFGSTELVRFFLYRGGDPNIRGGDGSTPLHRAAFGGSLDLVQLLVSRDADVNILTTNAVSSLASACLGGHFEMAKYLLANGAEVTPQDHANVQLLDWAITENKPEFFELFLSTQPKLNSRDGRGFTPINSAALKGRLEMVKKLLAAGADLEIKDNEGFTPFLSAVENGHLDIVQILSTRANVNAVNNAGKNALHLGVNHEKCRDLVNFLIEQKVDLNHYNGKGATPLHWAVLGGNLEACEALLEAGADPNLYSSKGFPLHAAYASEIIARNPPENTMLKSEVPPGHSLRDSSWKAPGSWREIIDLFSPLTPVGARNSEWVSPLHVAAAFGSPASVEDLLDRGADPNALDVEMKTPLWNAVFFGASLRTIQLLLNKGADLDREYEQGSPVLHYAAQYCRPDIVRALIEAGADIHARNYLRSTAAHWAAARGSPETLDELLRLGADPNAEDNNEMLPIMAALMMNNFENASRLLPYYKDVDRSVRALGTLLSLAAGQGAIDTVETLLQKNASVSSRGEGGVTPLYAAVHNHHLKVVEALLKAGAKQDYDGSMPVGKMVYNSEMARLLQRHRISLTTRDLKSFGTFETAVDRGFDDAVRYLLLNADNPTSLANSRVPDGRACIHLAAQAAFPFQKVDSESSTKQRNLLRSGPPGPVDYPEVMRLLLMAGADVTVRDPMQNTPLHTACNFTNGPAVEILLANGAPVLARNKSGETPLHIAATKKSYEISLLLLKYGANPLAEDSTGLTPLAIAKGTNSKQLITLLENQWKRHPKP